MIFLMFLALSQTSFSEEKKADVIIGGSIFKEKEEGKNAEYVRGAICYLNKVIDSDPNIIPKAIFYDNGNRPTRDLSNTRRLIFSDKASVLMGYSNMEGVLKSIEEAKKKDVVMAFPFVSLSQKDIDENSEDIFYLRPSIEKDLEALADFVNRHDVQKLAIVFEKEEEWQKEYISELTKIVPSVFSYIKDPLSMNEALMDGTVARTMRSNNGGLIAGAFQLDQDVPDAAMDEGHDTVITGDAQAVVVQSEFDKKLSK